MNKVAIGQGHTLSTRCGLCIVHSAKIAITRSLFVLLVYT